jgi:hypothetical protein
MPAVLHLGPDIAAERPHVPALAVAAEHPVADLAADSRAERAEGSPAAVAEVAAAVDVGNACGLIQEKARLLRQAGLFLCAGNALRQ